MKKVLVCLLVLMAVAGGVFADGVTVSTELGFGNLLKNKDNSGADYALIGTGDPSKGEYKPGQAYWVLPKFSVSKDVSDQLSFSANLSTKFVEANDGTPNEVQKGGWTIGDANATVTFTADALKVWLTLNDGLVWKPGVSYTVAEVITIQLELPFGSGDFFHPGLNINPKVSYSANGIGAWISAEFHAINNYEVDKIDGGWSVLKMDNDSDEFAWGLEVGGSYTAGALGVELVAWVPLFKDGIKYGAIDGVSDGLKITPKVSYEIIPGLKAWVNAAIGNIAADKDYGYGGKADITLKPALGVEYTFQ
ncbi:hypothetical protein FACS189498_1340 [Spirochaetia bacterium]|nr:hypothetical protein FACS189498_1340 [Spirochaetia bacterium]